MSGASESLHQPPPVTLFCRAPGARAIPALAALPQERQRACGAKKLEPCAAAPGLRTAGDRRAARSHQRALRASVEPAAKLLLSVLAAQRKEPARQPDHQALPSRADRVRATAGMAAVPPRAAARVTRNASRARPARLGRGEGAAAAENLCAGAAFQSPPFGFAQGSRSGILARRASASPQHPHKPTLHHAIPASIKAPASGVIFP